MYAVAQMQREHWIRPLVERAALPTILGVAVALRAWSVAAGVPYAVGIDEPAIIDRALRILNTGDWNPHIFDYPSLVIYVHAVVMVVLYIGGAVAGAWSSLATFDISAIYVTARLVTAAIGTATVWLTYRVGHDVGGRTLGLLAASQLAVLPIHVRESHFALTDVPVTALAMLAVWLSMRAAERGTVAGYAWAGAACGLAAAAKYNGVIACVAPLSAWLVSARAGAGRGRMAMAAVGAAVAAFVVATPFAVLDAPAFLSGFAAQAARFSGPRAGEAPWSLYLKHMALMGRLWLPVAAIGLVLVLRSRAMRGPAVPLLCFGAAYFYTLATHSLVFARYAVPLLPVVCVLAAVPLAEGFRVLRHMRRNRLAAWVMTAGVVALTAVFAAQSIAWVRQFARRDTREIVAAWMKDNVRPGTKVMVENSGPTYLRAQGLTVVPVELVQEHPLEWYREQGVAYLVISARDASPVRDYLKAGPVVFEAAPSDTRWGPPIRVVQLR